MLRDIDDLLVRNTPIEKARMTTVFIYGHSPVLSFLSYFGILLDKTKSHKIPYYLSQRECFKDYVCTLYQRSGGSTSFLENEMQLTWSMQCSLMAFFSSWMVTFGSPSSIG